MRANKALILGTLLMFIGMTALPLAAQEKEAREAVTGERKAELKELTIKNSGFRSRSTVVIRYRDEDKSIVEVIENGKKLPPSAFPRYESVMQKVLELPEIDRLIPEIERAYRMAESRRVSEERVYQEMMNLRSRLDRMNSQVARHYREMTDLQALASMNRRAQEISESMELSQEEKIQELKELIERSVELAAREEDMARRTRLPQFAATEAARKLIEEIERANQMSQSEKLREIRELLQKTQDMRLAREDARRGGVVEFQAAETLSRMIREISEKEELSAREKSLRMQALLEEARKMNLASGNLMIGVEKFKYDLHRLLETEGLLPEGQAEFVLRKNSSTIDGEKLPREIHERLKRMCEESMGKTFEGDTKIVMRLNEKR